MGARSSTWLITLGVALLASGVGAAWASTHPGHGNPDPGGRVLAALTSAERVVPAGADVMVRQAYEPRWDSCDGRAGTFGWNDITVAVQFRTTTAARALISSADATLRAAGWQRTTTLNSPLGPGAVWSRHIDGSTAARVTLAPSTRGAGTGTYWDLGAVAPPQGQHARGC